MTKLQLLVNRVPVDAICRVVHTSQAERLGRQWVTKFKEHVDRQMFGMSCFSKSAFFLLSFSPVYPMAEFLLVLTRLSTIEVVIQAAAGKKIVARETLKPFRKDVLAKLHASDVGRRRKLLDKQKAGRKRLRAVGNVTIDQSAFQSFLAK